MTANYRAEFRLFPFIPSDGSWKSRLHALGLNAVWLFAYSSAVFAAWRLMELAFHG